MKRPYIFISTGNIEDRIVALGPTLTVSQQMSLNKPLTKEEVKAALFSIPTHDNPDPCGYNSEFFKSNWPGVGD